MWKGVVVDDWSRLLVLPLSEASESALDCNGGGGDTSGLPCGEGIEGGTTVSGAPLVSAIGSSSWLGGESLSS